MKTAVSLSLLVLLAGGVIHAQTPAIPDCLEEATRPPLGTNSAAPPGNTEIRLRTDAIIGGWVIGDTLFIRNNGPVKFPIEYVNRDDCSYNPRTGIKIFSPDGATWAHATANGGNVKGLPSTMLGIWVDTTGTYLHKADLLGLFKFNLFGADGAGSDTVEFAGVATDAAQRAVPAQDSGIFFYVIIRPKVTDVGKHICVDSTFGLCASWKWASFNYQPAYSTFPLWRGPWCFVIGGCCQGLAGNVDCDPNDMCDISDLTEFIDRHYISLLPRCCPGEENIDGSEDGQSDISDLTALIDYLYISFTPPAPCP